MIRQHFHQMVRTQKGPVDQRLTVFLGHLSMLVDLEDRKQLRFPPGRLELAPFVFLPGTAFPLVFSHADPSSVDLHGHSPTGELRARWQASRTPSEQF